MIHSVRPVGLKQPNILGLYDIIRNAEELVLDLFRPTRPYGLSGQVGGILSKGGSSAFLRDDNTVGRRREAQALFTATGEGRTPTTGTRLAVSAPVFVGRRDPGQTFVEGRTNVPQEEALMAARTDLIDAGVQIGSASSADLQAEMDRLRDALREGELTQAQITERAQQLQIELERLNVSLGDQAAENVRLSIRSAMVTGNLMNRVGRNVFAGMREIVRIRENNPADVERQLARRKSALDVNESRIQAAFDLYLQVHIDLATLDEAFVLRIDIGESVMVIGYPVFSISPSLNATLGVVSSTVGLFGDRTRIQITAPMQPGNSGGPVVSKNGAQVAVVASKPSEALREKNLIENVGWVIRGAVAVDFLERLGVRPLMASDAFDTPSGTIREVMPNWRRRAVRVECHKF